MVTPQNSEIIPIYQDLFLSCLHLTSPPLFVYAQISHSSLPLWFSLSGSGSFGHPHGSPAIFKSTAILVAVLLTSSAKFFPPSLRRSLSSLSSQVFELLIIYLSIYSIFTFNDFFHSAEFGIFYLFFLHNKLPTPSWHQKTLPVELIFVISL